MLLFRYEILEMFDNTLTASGKYSRRNKENFRGKIQTELSQKTKNCSRCFIALLKSTLIFEYFEKKDESNSLSTCEIIDCERGCYLNFSKVPFQNTLRLPTCFFFLSGFSLTTIHKS